MVAETLNSFFSDGPRNLDIENTYLLNPTEGLTDPIDRALRKSESHPSILKIKENVSMSLFNFNAIRLEDVVLEVRNFNPNKASTSDNIPVKSLKENYDICSKVLHPIINKAILECTFPDKLKLADIAPLHKKDDTTNKKATDQ